MNTDPTHIAPSAMAAQYPGAYSRSAPTEENGEQNAAVTGTEQREDGGARAKDRVTLSREAMEIRELADRDREVRAHEAAHQAAGGSFSGAASYTYQAGPDGRRYAVGGEVPIDASAVPSDPEATIAKAETIRAAAMAPAQPSAQDLSVAASAVQMATNARAELQAQKAADLPGEKDRQAEGSLEPGAPAPTAEAKGATALLEPAEETPAGRTININV